MGIEKNIVSRTSGSGDSASQVCISNTIVHHKEVVTSPFQFDVPTYTLNGATFNYYMQTTDGISANLNNIKTLTFVFSANTNSLTGTTKFRHDIYKIDYNLFTAYTSSPLVFTTSTISNGALGPESPGSTATTILTQRTILSEASVTAFTQSAVDINTAMSSPFYTVYEEVSGGTFLAGSSHTLTLAQKVKPNGQYTQDFFVDKSQYFIDSRFMFEKPLDQTIGDVLRLENGQMVQVYDVPFSANTHVYSSSRTHIITGGTFSGLTISGATFTYFVPPKKADIFVVDGKPSVQGVLSTFAPIFSFKNVEDGDYYKVQINYNTGDTSFTGQTTSFNFNKQPGNAEYIRTVALAVTPNAEFLYRIGNTKEIINLFSVKQNITTWSEFAYAQSSNDGTFTLDGYTWLNMISGTPVANAVLTLTAQVSFSSVDLGSDTPLDPNTTSEVTNPLGGGPGAFPPIVSNGSGYFSFGKINGGQYTLTAQHPNSLDFPTQTFNFYLSQDTNLDIVFSIIWGNTTLDFTAPYTFL